MFTRFEILAEDRIGITVEILDKISKAGIDLLSVEVFTRRACVKLPQLNEKEKENIIKSIYSVKGVSSVHEIDLMDYEKNERRLLAVIDSADDGIIVVNNKYQIEVFNKYCEELYNHKKEEVLSKDFRDIVSEDVHMIKLIDEGIDYTTAEINIKGKHGNIHYISSGRAIKNDNGQTVGGVATIKDIDRAIEFANFVVSTEKGAFSDIIGSNKSLEFAKKIVSSVAKSNSTVLIRGESGTGKELFARAIKNLSNRASNSFVVLNCAAIPESLVESELFGYEKGSFTSAANTGKDGLFKEADGGTIFLDEIGELSLSVQSKLLRVIQEGTIRKIGSNTEERVDVRIIAATNKNLEKMLEENKFREDLYYRINVVPIFIPSLRERLDDIPVLTSHFINIFNKKLDKNIAYADTSFINSLMKYSWPGNIRELQNVIERSMLLCNSDILTQESLLFNFNSVYRDYKASTKKDTLPRLSDAVSACEKDLIIKALKSSKSIRKAADSLGISHTALLNKIKKYEL